MKKKGNNKDKEEEKEREKEEDIKLLKARELLTEKILMVILSRPFFNDDRENHEYKYIIDHDAELINLVEEGILGTWKKSVAYKKACQESAVFGIKLENYFLWHHIIKKILISDPSIIWFVENQSCGLQFTMMTSRKWRICSDLKKKNQKLVIPTSGTSLIGCTLSGSLRTKLRCTAVFNNLVK